MASNKSLDTILCDGVTEMDEYMASDPGRTETERKAIFMLGNTGSGKSTATQIIAGKLNQLRATKTDGGDLIIEDKGKKIGSSTKSMTLVPEYMIHPETGVAFWDTPGFDDNRGADTDIAAMYLLKHALDTTTLGKFIFVVNHSSVKTGNDRLDFDLLANHAITLLKNMSKMRDSVALLVTKVGNFSPSSGAYLSDDDILKPIKYFLETYVKTKWEDLESLQSKENYTEENERLEDEKKLADIKAKIDFVHALLGKDETEKQPQIFFIRSPQKEGPLQEMPPILESQKKITELYSEILKYTVVSPEDFQFTLKADTLLKIERDLLPEVSEKITATCKDFALDMKVQFQEKFYKNLFDSPEDSLKFLQKTLTVMKKRDLTGPEINNNQVTTSFCSELEELLQELQFSMNPTFKTHLTSFEKQLEFFAKVLNENTARARNQAWITPFTEFSTALEDLNGHYEFCNSTQVELAEYDKVGKFTNLVKHCAGPILFEDANVLNFLGTNGLVSQVSSKTREIWEKLRYEDKEYLVRLVKRMAPRLDMKCSKSTMNGQMYRLIITGRNIKLSDAMNESNWPQECKNGNVKELSLVAADKLFLDIDVKKAGKTLQLSMIAPRWEVVLLTDSRRDIDLSGVQPASFLKADSAYQHGGRGSDGTAGRRGVDAGSFLGVYSQVENSEKLLIFADGGQGGNGQEGGNGKEGANGKDAGWRDFPNAYDFGKVEKMPGKDLVVAVFYNCERYIKRGWGGGRGGDGGHGGKAGDPGNSGTILLIQSRGNNEGIRIQKSSAAGKVGNPGAGGRPGVGGKHGNDYSQLLQNILFVGFKWDQGRSENRSDLASSGNPGCSGGGGVPNSALTPVHMVSREINVYLTVHSKTMCATSFPQELRENAEVSRIISSQPQSEKLVVT